MNTCDVCLNDFKISECKVLFSHWEALDLKDELNRNQFDLVNTKVVLGLKFLVNRSKNIGIDIGSVLKIY